MNKIILVDSCCNLPDLFYEENKNILHMMKMPIALGDKNFLDDHGLQVSNKKFYTSLKDGVIASTSQITPTKFFDKFNKLYKENKEVLYISFSSGMSGTYNNAIIAKQMFLEDYPDAKISIVDSYCASTGYGVIVKKAIEMLKDNDILTIMNYIEENRLKINHIFSVDDLMFLKRGGRIPPTLATVGTLLNIKPVMDIDKEGKLRQIEKVRGRKKVYKKILQIVKEKYNHELSPIIIGHGDCEKDAIEFKSMIENELGYTDIIITEESPAIGSHVGPGLIIVGFMGKERS